MKVFGSMHGLKLAAAVVAALALGACAKNPTDVGALDTRGGAGGAGGMGGAGAGAASPGSQQDFAVNVGDRVFFDSDSTELNGTAQATLDKQARWLNQYGSYAFTVEGHADERGTREYNFALGARRAEAAKNYLVSRGVAPRASRPFPSARNGRSRFATIFPAGRRIGAPLPCSRAARARQTAPAPSGAGGFIAGFLLYAALKPWPPLFDLIAAPYAKPVVTMRRLGKV